MSMETSKDSLRDGEEFQDGPGLELNLCLSLSSTDSRQKWKASEAASAPSASFIDPVGEPFTGATLNGSHSLAKHKPSNKPSGINTAINKFLRLTNFQDENAPGLGGTNLNREKERLFLQASHDKSSQLLDMAVPDEEGKGNPFQFKELQGASGLACSRSQSPSHTTPLQLVDAFKNNSKVSSPGSAEAGCVFGEDDSVREDFGQHKSVHDDQKKRKHLLDRQKHLKRGKIGEAPPDVENLLHGVKVSGTSGQIHRATGQEKQNFTEAEKGCDTDGDETPCCEKFVNEDLSQNAFNRTSNESKGTGANFLSQRRPPETTQKSAVQTEDPDTWHHTVPMKLNTAWTAVLEREGALKRTCTGPTYQKEGPILVVGATKDRAGSPSQRTQDKALLDSGSVSTGGIEKEKSGGVEASSLVLDRVSDKALPSTSLMANPYCSPVPATSSAQASYAGSPYPIMPCPSPVTFSVPHAHGNTFTTGVNFPCVMQYSPPGSESSEHVRPVGTAAFQHPAIDYSSQLSPLDTPWMLPFRSPGVSSFTNANGALYNRNLMGAMSDDANVKLSVARMHDSGAGNSSLGADTSSLQKHTLQATVHNSAHDQLSDMPALSSSVPHFSSHLGVSDHLDIQSLKDPNSNNSFSGFSASVKGPQVHASPGVGMLPCNGNNRDDSGQGGRSSSPAILQNLQMRNMMGPNNASQEEAFRAVENESHQGSTENVLDLLGEDLAFLQCGLAPGSIKFGGTGTAPNLPWVHAAGPNGRTIGGVIYRLSQTQLRVVCACHGRHMSPVEFAEHAGIMDVAMVDKNSGVTTSLAT